MKESLQKSLNPAVAQMQKAYNRAQQLWAEGQEEAFGFELENLKKAVDDYDSTASHIKVHAKPKSQPKAKGKAKVEK